MTDGDDTDHQSLSDVVAWEPETPLDHTAVWLNRWLHTGLRWLVYITAVVILTGIVIVTGLGAVTDPIVFSLVVLSIVPALGLAAFIVFADVGADEPLSVLTATFLLGVLFAAFAGVLNALGLLLLGVIPVATTILFFYLVVGPVEEGVKLLAVRLHAYRHRSFDAVLDGAIYGAVAGLGFATIENALYITDAIDTLGEPATVLDPLAETAAARALAGPGHVIYSAIAGYYLGLAKFNPQYAGALVIKGLTIAALIHATYNVALQFVPGLFINLAGLSVISAIIAFVIIYDGLAAYYLYRKLARYRRAYLGSRGSKRPAGGPEMTEFDP